MKNVRGVERRQILCAPLARAPTIVVWNARKKGGPPIVEPVWRPRIELAVDL